MYKVKGVMTLTIVAVILHFMVDSVIERPELLNDLLVGFFMFLAIYEFCEEYWKNIVRPASSRIINKFKVQEFSSFFLHLVNRSIINENLIMEIEFNKSSETVSQYPLSFHEVYYNSPSINIVFSSNDRFYLQLRIYLDDDGNWGVIALSESTTAYGYDEELQHRTFAVLFNDWEHSEPYNLIMIFKSNGELEFPMFFNTNSFGIDIVEICRTAIYRFDNERYSDPQIYSTYLYFDSPNESYTFISR